MTNPLRSSRLTQLAPLGVADVIEHRLAVGIATVDARTGEPADVEIVLESVPSPYRRPKGFDPDDPGIGLPRLATTRIGRARVLQPTHQPRVTPPGPPVLQRPCTIRVIDRLRRFAPRRLLIPVPTMAAVLAAEARQVTGPRRSFTLGLFPGATYPVSGGDSGIRGAVVTVDGRPAKWARVIARIVEIGNQDGPVIGRANGDDRGEFLLLFSAPTVAVAWGSSLTATIRLTVGIPPPPTGQPSGDLGDPITDPLALLPVERLTGTDPDQGWLAGTIPRDYRQIGPFTVAVPIGSVVTPDPYRAPA